jgi:hypothetical protein
LDTVKETVRLCSVSPLNDEGAAGGVAAGGVGAGFFTQRRPDFFVPFGQRLTHSARLQIIPPRGISRIGGVVRILPTLALSLALVPAGFASAAEPSISLSKHRVEHGGFLTVTS